MLFLYLHLLLLCCRSFLHETSFQLSSFSLWQCFDSCPTFPKVAPSFLEFLLIFSVLGCVLCDSQFWSGILKTHERHGMLFIGNALLFVLRSLETVPQVLVMALVAFSSTVCCRTKNISPCRCLLYEIVFISIEFCFILNKKQRKKR